MESSYSNQRVDVDQALRLMTAGPAFAAFQEKDLGILSGILSVGRYADFTVLCASLYQMPSNELSALTIRMTAVAERVTFDAGDDQTAARP
jgi:predicted amidohydrolase YtcJ